MYVIGVDMTSEEGNHFVNVLIHDVRDGKKLISHYGALGHEF
jgi:hypothetical protein